MKFHVILFDRFETLDAMGPVEIIGNLTQYYDVGLFSEYGGAITSAQKATFLTRPISEITEPGIILIPGGDGTRSAVKNEAFIAKLKALCEQAEYVMTVCTGTSLPAKAGLLKGCRATTNKISFDWVASQDADVQWVRKARWVADGKYYTSSGVTAGMDMALGFISERHGEKTAETVAKYIEYIWNKDRDNDPFAVVES